MKRFGLAFTVLAAANLAVIGLPANGASLTSSCNPDTEECDLVCPAPPGECLCEPVPGGRGCTE